MQLPLHIACSGNRHVDIGFGQRHSDSSSVCGGIDTQIVIFDVISRSKIFCVPILPRVSFVLILVTQL
jgi:hypothetical protein